MLTRDRIASRKGAKGAKEIRSVLATRVRDADVRCPWRDAEFRFGYVAMVAVTLNVTRVWHRLIVRNCGLRLRKLKADR